MEKSILLSIRPRYVNAIISGEKRFEFRKSIFRSPDITKIYIYASAPVKKIVGYFNLGDILHGNPHEIWERCSDLGGISKEEFFKYYEGKENAFSLCIDKLNIFEHAICPYTTFENFTPPQSFMYFDGMESKI